MKHNLTHKQRSHQERVTFHRQVAKAVHQLRKHIVETHGFDALTLSQKYDYMLEECSYFKEQAQ